MQTVMLEIVRKPQFFLGQCSRHTEKRMSETNEGQDI